MNAKLAELYGNDFVVTSDQPDLFHWYRTTDGERFGIRKTRLTNEENELLNAFFPTAQLENEFMTMTQKKWTSLLFEDDLSVDLTIDLPIRYIHFNLKNAPSDLSDFTEAITGLFSDETILLFENDKEGLLVQTNEIDEQMVDELKQTAAALTADFFTGMSLFVGQTIQHSDNSQLKRIYKAEKKWFSTGRNLMPSQMVFTHQEIVPSVIFHDASDESIDYLIKAIQPVQHDTELLKSIRIYLESNLNITLAAKQLYVHRNSLQYRVDKFIEKTGIDVKSFQGAVMVYLSLLAMELR
ncbi:PucR family transcriptional regulator [Guptibacillus hwajinpoensis]|uniref:PucR family transcriptional regulator n=1 Tax=Guptibacillus hwajinpoensis TaxID=208199 RepID=UPI001CFF4F02|nr:helix-turn-helix domain-containing protein [Pseudalkalibacillus hwajinpoensis]WLR58445.1 helix-turn-helix domain-containing protein [Pseudalkalibacillus hwajinpoensis]